MKPLVSVVMTAYNAEKYILDSVKSILQQDYKEFEYVIVDNCSTDATSSIIKSIKDSRINYIRNESNIGQTRALNVGIHQSHGELIARMDADDISDLSRLSKQVDYLKNHPEVAVVGSWCTDINEQGKVMRLYKVPEDPMVLRCYLAVSGELSRWVISHPTVMMRRKDVLEVGCYSEINDAVFGYPQDYDLWNKLLLRGKRLGNIGESLLKYRIVAESESRGQVETLLRHRLDISRNKICQLCPEYTTQEVEQLALMLEFLPQADKADINSLFKKFMAYFHRWMECFDSKDHSKVINEYGQMWVLNYLPVLFKSQKKEVFKKMIESFTQYPSLIFKLLPYSKLLKINC